jgi:hypothetical protein
LKASVVVGAVLPPELEDGWTVPVGEACIDNVLLEDVVMGEAAVEAAEPESVDVCGRANAGISTKLSTIICMRIILEGAMIGKLRGKWGGASR